MGEKNMPSKVLYHLFIIKSDNAKKIIIKCKKIAARTQNSELQWLNTRRQLFRMLGILISYMFS